MKRVLALLLRPPLPQVLGLLLLCAVVFWGGRALRSVLGLADGTLLAICGALWLVALGVHLWRRVQAARRARLIEDRLRGQAREHAQAVRPDRRAQVEALEARLTEALEALKSSKMGKSALYALPWYIVIGPPGSGKTTLLRESGLSFPQLTHGRGVRGVGGTRNCDWWFTDAGILLDTAGRYTTQAEDRDEWLSFLDMLKKARVQKPINGAVIAISIADVLQASDEQLAEHTRLIRERLAELTERLELVFPVYLLFTKCDLLDGFVETFGTWSKQERAQVWGFTLPYGDKTQEPVERHFDREFAALHERLCAERLHALATSKSQDRKRKVFSFPLQFQLARQRLREFVAQLGQPNPYHESSEIRGFYFTSGTQEGKPFDQILRTMRAAAGLQVEEPTQAEQPVDKKAYFIDELFTQVVFPDQELARSSTKAEQQRLLLRRAALAATVVLTFAAVVLLFVAYAGHSNLIDRAERVHAAAVEFDPADDAALRREERGDAAAPFEALRQLYVELDDAYGGVWSYVLGQVNELHDRRVRPLYVQKLRATFVEPLQRRLRDRLVAALADDARGRDVRQIADELAGYRMLGGELLLNREWLGEDFLRREDMWTWRPGTEVEACRPHRQTFVERVVDPGSRDWAFLPEESLIPKINELVRGKDLFGRELQSVLEEQGQAKTVSWSEILASHPQARLLDDSVGVVAAWFNEAPIDDILEEKGELLGGNGADSLKARRRQEAIADWKQKLGAMRPRRLANVEDAVRDVVALCGEDSLYLLAYREVCDRLAKLGVECRAGDTAWLGEVLQEVRALEQTLAPLYASRNLGDRIVPEARRGEAGQLAQVREALRRVRKQIRTRTELHADPQLRDAIQRALIGAVDSVQHALARELEIEANKVWQRGLGGELATFSRQFPCLGEATAVVEAGRFETVFGRNGAFDEARGWIDYLQATAAELGFVELDPAFAADRAFVERLQAALFVEQAARAGCKVEFQLQRLGNVASVRFELGEQRIEALRTETRTLDWRPVLGASITVANFPAFDGKVDAQLAGGGDWGLLRLLSAANTSTATVQGKDYVVYRFSEFLHPRSRQPLAIGDDRAEAALLLRTEIEPNPLAPGFFVHRFASEVFRGIDR